VPNKASHVAVARDNETLISELNLDSPAARGWAATIAFYAALHYVEAFFSLSNVHSADHRTRDSNLCRFSETLKVYDPFCELKNISTNARYMARYPTKNEINLDVMPALRLVKVEMEKYL
jgi:hypothetical protein